MCKKNKYVSFVSDDDFLESVNHVFSTYERLKGHIDMVKMQRQIIDPFKMVFDMYSLKTGLDKWILNEKIRQDDKTVNNSIGEFHQILLGKVEGWIDLGIGDATQVDLKNDAENIFIEIKNKHNTVNKSSKDRVRDNLEAIAINYPTATAYYAYIITQKPSGENVWKYKEEKYPTNERIREIRGRAVYELVTGNPNALDEVWKALPLAITELSGDTFSLKKNHQSTSEVFLKYAFESYAVRREIIEKGYLTRILEDS